MIAELREAVLLQRETIARLLGTYAADAERVLEFTRGTGEFTRLAAGRTGAKQITVVDISGDRPRRTRVPVRDDVELVRGDFWADLGVGRSDVIVCVDAIHHLGDLRQVLERLKTFVSPGGILVGSVRIADNLPRLQRPLSGALAHLRRTGAYRVWLVPSADALAILHDVFEPVIEVRVENHFMGFVCGMGTV